VPATPPPPTIDAPAGPLPAGPVGLAALAQVDGASYARVGSGFVLALPAGGAVGALAAHSLPGLGDAGHAFTSIALALPAAPTVLLIASGTLYGAPGVPRTGEDLAVDYVLLRLHPAAFDPALALPADPRGAAQPGERVLLYGGDGAARPGTVLTSASTATWALMDERFEPAGLSGAPVLSAHTGRVVGMAIAASRRAGRVLIGFGPVSGLLARAAEAAIFPAIAGYTR
jgi:hypothetical protein